MQARENGSDLLAESIARWAGVVAPERSEQFGKELAIGDLGVLSAEQGPVDDDAGSWMRQFLVQNSILPREDARLRAAGSAGLTSVEFDHLRKTYQQPAEWTGQTVTIRDGQSGFRVAAERLGLTVASEEGSDHV